MESFTLRETRGGSIAEWITREKEWIFSGIGLTLIGGLLLFARWLLGFMIPHQVFATVDELRTFQSHVDERFKVLNSWIQLLYSRQSPEYKRAYNVGFQEAPATFFTTTMQQQPTPLDPEQSKPSGNELPDMPESENAWSEGLASMARLKAHNQVIADKAARLSSARKSLLILATALFAVAALAFAVSLF